MRRTPHDPRRAERLASQGGPVWAVVQAWTQPGDNPEWHEACKRELRESMPVLAYALDRLAKGQS